MEASTSSHPRAEHARNPARLSTTPVAVYARTHVVTVAHDLPAEGVLRLLEERGISAVPVLDAEGAPIGVVSRTDLLRVGAPRCEDGRYRSFLVDLPALSATDVMHRGVVTVRRTTSVAEAAEVMAKRHLHRVFVEDERGGLSAVFGTREAMLAIGDARIDTPIGSVMSRGALTVPWDAATSLATSRLAWADAQGLVVVENDWPLGLFTQREALLARASSPNQPVEDAMSHALLCLRTTTPLHRAALQAAHTKARRVLVVEDRKLVGMLTGLDFARLARDIT
jgi:CBS domain-containing protein